MTDQTLQVQGPGVQMGPPPKPGNRGIHGFTWAIWPWMNWVLPVAAVVIAGAITVSVQVYRVGESGARAAWGDFQAAAEPLGTVAGSACGGVCP